MQSFVRWLQLSDQKTPWYEADNGDGLRMPQTTLAVEMTSFKNCPEVHISIGTVAMANGVLHVFAVHCIACLCFQLQTSAQFLPSSACLSALKTMAK